MNGSGPAMPLVIQLAAELQAMASYAAGSGLAMPPAVVDVVARIDAMGVEAATDEDAERAALVQAHDRMRLLVAPATPRTLLLLDEESRRLRRLSWLPALGPVRTVRHLTVAALVLLGAFILLGLSGEVNRDVGGILDEAGLSLLLNLLFVLSAAGLGAAFAALFQASRHVREGVYDPRDDSTYWLNIVLGLIAGLLLAELLPDLLGEDPEGGFNLARPILALVGGFSAAVVFRILRRLVDATESIFAGDIRERVQAEVQAAQARLATQQAEDRLRLSASLIQIEQQLNAGSAPEEVADLVRGVLDELLPFATSEGPSVPAARLLASDAEASALDTPAEPPASSVPASSAGAPATDAPAEPPSA